MSRAGGSAHEAPPAAASSTTAALAFMVFSAALLAGTSIIAKALSIGADGGAGLHPLQVSAGRFAFALLSVSLFLVFQPSRRPPLDGTNWRWHLCRSFFGWLGITAMFAAVARMPVAEANAIGFLSPLVTMALAAIMLGETLGLRKIGSAALALVGALLILKPGTDAFQVAGLIALLAACFMGFEAIFIKLLSDTEPALRVLLINNTLGASVAVSVALFVWVPPTGAQWALLAALGTVMIIAQASFIQSMKRADASTVIPGLYTVLAFAALMDAMIYGVVPDWVGALGILFIVAGAILLSRSGAKAR